MISQQAAPIVHSVHFYESEEALIQRLGSIVLSGMDAGVSALLVMTEAHKRAFQKFLSRRNVDLHRAERDGLLCVLDAETTLKRFMVNGFPDENLFRASVGSLVRDAQTHSQRSGLTVFGEMVAILWEQGNKEGAIQLERLWNELLQDNAFHLHCAYPKALFKSRKDRCEITEICEHHSLSVGHAAA